MIVYNRMHTNIDTIISALDDKIYLKCGAYLRHKSFILFFLSLTFILANFLLVPCFVV